MAKRRKHKQKNAIIGGVVFLFVVVLVAALLFWTEPPTAQLTWRGGPGDKGHIPLARDEAVELCDKMMVVKWQSYGRKMVVQCSVSAKPAADQRKELTQRVKKQESRIKDKVRHAIGTVPLEDLHDPKLTMVKRDIKRSVDQIVGKGVVKDILIPVWHTSQWY